MQKLLDEYPLVVLPSLACDLGLNEAIILQQIHYWLQKVRPMDDGLCWVYNTIPQWQKQFPFWSERTIFSTLKNLREVGVLIADYKSNNQLDRTLYYRIDYTKIATSIPQKLRDGRRKSCEISNNTETTRDYFGEFWKTYPKRVAKEDARKAFSKIKMDEQLFGNIIKAINNQGLCNREIQFVPNPATWLNKRRWEDEVQSSPSSTDWWMNDRRAK